MVDDERIRHRGRDRLDSDILPMTFELPLSEI